MSNAFRIEKDSMGEMEVPDDAYYGAQTARAIENFPISRLRFHRPIIKALGLLKKAAAETNVELGKLDAGIGKSIAEAAQEVVDGKWDDQFIVDIFQTGSGTSTNMNTNEIIANRAIEIHGGTRGDKSIHPNDHVNLGQSSNDIIPSAIHLAAMDTMVHDLIPALNHLYDTLLSKSRDFAPILKIGRTHLQDATPIRLGQEFSGYARQVQLGIDRLWAVEERLGELALGGTAVGTGINTHPEFAKKAIQRISDETGLNITEAQNHFEAQGARDACVETSGSLRTIAASLIKIANDVRFLGSGPRCGLGEIKLEATQPGSSIMPGKVNPVMCEMLIMVGAQVIGNDATVGFSGTFGNFELNVMLPVIGHNLLESMEILSTGSRVFADRAIKGLEADKDRCESLIEQSLAMCTSLAPVIGYDQAAAIAKTAYASGKTIREVALAESGLSADQLNDLLDAASQTQPKK